MKKAKDGFSISCQSAAVQDHEACTKKDCACSCHYVPQPEEQPLPARKPLDLIDVLKTVERHLSHTVRTAKDTPARAEHVKARDLLRSTVLRMRGEARLSDGYSRRNGDDELIGRVIVGVRRMNPDEMDDAGWHGTAPVVLALDDGTIMYPSRDPEGNGPGTIFGQLLDGTPVAW